MSNLDKRIAEANAAGLSYGKYMATIAYRSKPEEPVKQEKSKEKPVEIRKCQWCGADFPVYSNRKKIYCSYECSHNASRKKSNEYWKRWKEKQVK